MSQYKIINSDCVAAMRSMPERKVVYEGKELSTEQIDEARRMGAFIEYNITGPVVGIHFGTREVQQEFSAWLAQKEPTL